MQNPRATVLQLIAYVVDPAANENEARSMAVRVCHLIVKHKLLEAAPVPRAATGREPRWEDLFTEIMQGRYRRPPSAPAAPAGTEPWDVSPEEPAPAPPQPTVPGSRKVAPDPDARLITVLQPAWCPGCGQKLVYGRYGTRSRGEVWHPSCLETAMR